MHKLSKFDYLQAFANLPDLTNFLQLKSTVLSFCNENSTDRPVSSMYREILVKTIVVTKTVAWRTSRLTRAVFTFCWMLYRPIRAQSFHEIAMRERERELWIEMLTSIYFLLIFDYFIYYLLFQVVSKKGLAHSKRKFPPRVATLCLFLDRQKMINKYK